MATQPFDNLLADGIDRIEGQQRLLKIIAQRAPR
jgi:hypothetical protein